MKRGFLNTPRSKRVIEEAYAPKPPPGPEPSHHKRASQRIDPRPMQDGGKDAMDVYVFAIAFTLSASNGVAGVETAQWDAASPRWARRSLPMARHSRPLNRSIMITSTSRRA
jgi:hypothetical protein